MPSITDRCRTEIYTLSLHDALPIWMMLNGGSKMCLGTGMGVSLIGKNLSFRHSGMCSGRRKPVGVQARNPYSLSWLWRSEEHTSELQSRFEIVCRLLLVKKKRTTRT